MSSLKPWWEELKLRQEILDASGQIDDVQMSLFQAVHGEGPDRPAYADAAYYGEITHPTERLTDLLTEIAVRIGGGEDYLKARAVTRLDQGMGGGKSHACIGAYHLASDPEGLFRTALGDQVNKRAKAKIGRKITPGLGDPRVVVLPCDSMTPGASIQDLDGPASSLYERFLWRLFSKDYPLYEQFLPFFSDKNQIGEAIRAVGRPVLIIMDEILDYVGNGLDGVNRPELVAQDMAFLRALLDVVNDVPHVALIAVMIASDQDKTSLSLDAMKRRDDLNTLLERNGTPATVTEVGDFADILRRRLFESGPSAGVLSKTADEFDAIHENPGWIKSVWEPTGSAWRSDWASQVSDCYPFHPLLMSIAREEWSQVTGFQRVRSTIRIFAATVFAQQQRGLAGEWVPALIGPGDLPLSDSAVREAIFGSGLVEDDRTIANYRSLAELEVVNNDESGGAARLQDIGRNSPVWGEANPRASERAATFVFLASIVGTLRPGRGRGASAPEVKAACSVPDESFTLTDVDTVIEELMGQDEGMTAVEVLPGKGHNKPARYFLSTRLTYRMLVNNIRRTILDSERDEALAEFSQRLTSSGPFRETKYVASDSSSTQAEVLQGAGIDTSHTTRLIVLDPSQFSLRNGTEKKTIDAIEISAGLGSGKEKLPVQWASSAIYAVVNAQRRSNARGIAVEYLARQKALSAPEVQADEELKSSGTKELSQAKAQLEKAVKKAFQHVVYLAQPDPDDSRRLEQITFDDEHSTALDGTIVWKALAEKDKVFDAGDFGPKALLHNLRDVDYGRTLSDLRALFYSAPRFPLLYAGDQDLQKAIFDAVNAGLIDVVDGSGAVVAVTASNQVNLASTGLRLSKHESDLCPECGAKAHDGPCNTGEAGETDKDPGTPTIPLPAPVAEKRLAFSFTKNLLSDTDAGDEIAELFKFLYKALDERQSSYLQSTIQIVLDTDSAHDLDDLLTFLGINATLTDM